MQVISSLSLSVLSHGGSQFFRQHWNYLDFGVRTNVLKWLLSSSRACVQCS